MSSQYDGAIARTDASKLPVSKTHHNKHGSRTSIDTIGSTRSHKEYIDSLVAPSPGEIQRIARVQEAKEEEITKRDLAVDGIGLNDHERAKAASLIQRNYRGYRTRRQLQGFGLDASSRWVDAIREARFRNMITPRTREHLDKTAPDGTTGHTMAESQRQFAREKWKQVGSIARRATIDEDSDLGSDDEEDIPEDQREERHKERSEKKKERQKRAKTLDLQYFLEMVDLKHRYGTNLRVYHEEWKSSATRENFFYWLDEGEGRLLDMAGCPRERLDHERIRYLSREERLNYLVKIEKKNGLLCWAKNGAHIDTTTKYKDSIHGIVPATDSTPAYVWTEPELGHELLSDSSSSSSEADHKAEAIKTDGNMDPELSSAKLRKVKHVSASTILNTLLRGSVKKNTWIFVTDTNFRLYVGIKQSGAFQHSSFLQGSRIAAAGLIKIKDGRLEKLSPLSGHYRPPTSQFREFVHSLKDAGADMSHVSISRSYAILVGLEMYVNTRRRGKRLLKTLIHGRDKLLTHDQLAKREEEALDRHETVERERRMFELQHEEEERDENKANLKLMNMLHVQPITPKHAIDAKPGEHPGGQEGRDFSVHADGPKNVNEV